MLSAGLVDHVSPILPKPIPFLSNLPLPRSDRGGLRAASILSRRSERRYQRCGGLGSEPGEQALLGRAVQNQDGGRDHTADLRI